MNRIRSCKRKERLYNIKGEKIRRRGEDEKKKNPQKTEFG
jgi:hypothetical protein